jgi:hypothetical protein
MKPTRNSRRETTPPSIGPFSVGEVKTVLREVLKQGSNLPGPTEAVQLTYALNLIQGSYVFAQQVANDSKKTADQVRSAIKTLQRFLDIRRLAWEAPGTTATTVAAEAELLRKFSAFAAAMQAQLDMDDGLKMPDITGWHHLAFSAAAAFRSAVRPNNPGVRFGPTSGGPLSRFLAEVLSRITGERVTAAAAGQYLRRAAKGRTGAPPGLVLLTVEECAAAADDQQAAKE